MREPYQRETEPHQDGNRKFGARLQGCNLRERFLSFTLGTLTSGDSLRHLLCRYTYDDRHSFNQLAAMRRSRQFRCITVFITLFSLLFMQLAVASYSCPGEMPRSEEAYADSGALVQHEASGCAGMDKAQPSLCHAHAQTGHQSLDKPELPQVGPFVAAYIAASFVLCAAHEGDAPPRANLALLMDLSAPSLAIQYCCFRL